MRLDVRWFTLALLLPLSASWAGTSAEYAYAFSLDTNAPAEAYRVVLNPTVYASANPSADLRDVVVVNALGRPVPFGPLPPSPPVPRHVALEARLLPLPAGAMARNGVEISRNADGGIVISQPSNGALSPRPRQWLVDAGRAITLESVALDPSSLQEDFQLQLAVDASNDLRQWHSLVNNVALVRVHGEQGQVEQLSIETPTTMPSRYYRLRLIDGDVDWSAGHAPAVRLDGNDRDAMADRASQLHWLAATNSSSNGSDYDFTLPATLPVEAVKVQLPATNTAARVHLMSPAGEGQTSWIEVASLDLVRAAGKEGDATATFAPRAAQHLRLHSDTPLAEAPRLSIGWLPPQYVYLAEGGGPYRLLVGSYAARRGDYPVDEALEKLRAKNGAAWLPPMATLGARVDEAGAQALQAPKVPYDWTKPLLWAVLVVGALMVAAMALRLLRDAKRDGAGS